MRNFHTSKSKFDLTLCQSRLHTASETFVRQKKKKKKNSEQVRFSAFFASLIFLVSQHKALYEKQSADYKDIEYKERLWLTIAEKLGKDDRDTYVRQKKKVMLAIQKYDDECESVVTETESEVCTTPYKSDDGLARYCQWKEARDERREKERQQRQALEELKNDEVSTFLSSLAPCMRRLSPEKRSYLKIKMQELVHDVAFGGVYYQQFSQDPTYRSL
uniref:BESS domain-containing protein n=1 Tax=Cyprinus carpio TaxID=7962 RepID=A0A8C1VSP3_CYPCA